MNKIQKSFYSTVEFKVNWSFCKDQEAENFIKIIKHRSVSDLIVLKYNKKK